MIDLSILICSTNTRANTFGKAIQDQVWSQYDALPVEDQARIEILMLTDNKKMMLGHKRNVMVDMAQGRYVQFVDDDDRIEPDMFASVLEATSSDADVITFQVSVSLNGARPKICTYSKDFAEDRNTIRGYERLPNHICAVKRDLARQVSYPNVLYGEDTGYSKLLHPLLKSEHRIDRVLYHYDYNVDTTETQFHLRNQSRRRPDITPIVDVVILSKASTAQLRRMTQRTIDTCVAGANTLPIGITVVEQVKNIRYKQAATIYRPGDFNYNQFANDAAARGSAEWIMIANNDLVFRDGWLHHLLAAKHPFVSPKCPNDQRQTSITENTEGDVTGRHMSGWCFMITRDLWEQIDGFDEDVAFWCADDVVIEQTRKLKIQPMLVPAAEVEHAQSLTFNTEVQNQAADKDDLTWKQLDIFITKYGSHRLQHHPDFKRWKAC